MDDVKVFAAIVIVCFGVSLFANSHPAVLPQIVLVWGQAGKARSGTNASDGILPEITLVPLSIYFGQFELVSVENVSWQHSDVGRLAAVTAVVSWM